MTLSDAIILGIIQGITEFLRISSSGHLVIAQVLLGINMPGNVLEVITHIGTLFSIIFVFWKELISIIKTIQNSATKKYILLLFIGTLPALVIGLGGKNIISGFFDSIYVVGGALLFTGIILLATQKLSLNNKQLNWKKSLVIGIAQAIAIIPGVSRSGMTICTSLALGISGKDAAKFSFLLAIPTTLIASGKIIKTKVIDFSNLEILIVGSITSFLFAIIAIKTFLKIVEKYRFIPFGIYLIVLGLLIQFCD